MSKNGFSYYKAETDRFQDIKIKRLKKKYGCDGYAVYQYALNEIYRVDGSYIRWTEDQLFDCADYWGMNEERVKEIVDYCAEICLFDPVVWKMKCILTSRAIQTRYIDICKLAKKKMYIPLDILLVEPEQPMKEPVSMPLFEAETAEEPTGQNTPDGQNTPTGQNTPDVSMSPTTVESTFEKVPEGFQNFPETSGNLPEKIDKEKKSKEKENKEKSSSIPLPATPTAGELTEEEARALLSSTPLGRSKPETTIAIGGNIAPTAAGQRPPQVEAAGREQKPRNPKGLIDALSPYNLSSRELEEVLKLSGHGEIGNPVWQILGEMHGNKRLKMPRLFLLKRLRDSVGLITDSSYEHSGTRNKSAS